MGRGYPMSLDATCFNGQAEKPEVLEQFHAKHPDRPVVLTETPHSYNTRGVYRTRTWLRDPGVPHFDVPNLTDEELFFYDSNRNFSSYDNATIRVGIRECWRRTAEMDFVVGQFHWTYWDYAGESEYHGTNHHGSGDPDGRFWPRGIVDMAMIRKDHSYYYESQFSDRAMVHLLPHWTHPKLKPGAVVPVWAYTNCDEVELFLNETSLGRQSIQQYGNGAWDVPYEPGVMVAIGYRNGVEVVRSEQRTAGAPVTLSLVPDDHALMDDNGDMTRVEITACDASGTPVPWAMNTVAMHVSGPHRFLGAENGDRLDFTALRSPQRRLYFGKLASFYGTTADAGDITLTAASILGERHGATGRQAFIAVDQYALRGSSLAKDIVLRYTIDGSEPTETSPLYDASTGVVIDNACTIRVQVWLDGIATIALAEEFLIGERPIQPMKPGHNPDDDQTLVGIRDEEALGWWINPANQMRYEFRPDGTLHQMIASGISDLAGRWWYDYPNDRDEDPDDHGVGEIKMNKRPVCSLRMTSRAADEIIVGDDLWRLVRCSAPEV